MTQQDHHDHHTHANGHSHDQGNQHHQHAEHSHHDHSHEHSHHDHSHHGHSHGHTHVHEVTADSEHRVFAALIITAIFMVIEIVAGITSHSLALISDGVHMLSDAFSLGLALYAFKLGKRPPNETHSYGYQRMQVLAAFTNGVILLIIGLWIVIEAVERLFTPEPVDSTSMLIVAIIGLIVNGLSFWILESGDEHNLNMRGAALHVLGDLLGSVAAIIAALIIKYTGFYQADPLLSILACVLIFRASMTVLRRSSRILLEGTPEELDSENVRQVLKDVSHVVDVHDLHLWGLTDNDILLTAHLVIESREHHDVSLSEAHTVLRDRFGIGHATLQVEHGDMTYEEACCHGGQHR